MKKLILVALLMQFGCISKPSITHVDKNVIPSSWLTNKISVNAIHERNFSFCSALRKIKSSIKNDLEMKEGVLHKNDELKLEKKTSVPRIAETHLNII